MPPNSFTAALIAALEEAQAAAAQPKAPAQLAEAAWGKLQYDFPVVSADELAALVHEYASGARTSVTARFLGVVREAAAAVPPAGDPEKKLPGTSNGLRSDPSATVASASTAGEPLVSLYQRLYAVSVLQSLRGCLDAPEATAVACLQALQPADGLAANGSSYLGQQDLSVLEEALAAAVATGQAPPQLVQTDRPSQQEDDDNTDYEPLEQPQAQQQQQQQLAGVQAAAVPAQAVGGTLLPEQLARLAEHLSYHCMADAAGWRELGLMQRVAGCLAALRRHARCVELVPVAQPLLRLAADRMVACPIELETGLPALLDALAIPGGKADSSSSSANRQDAAAAAAAAELALAAAVALAGQISSPSARRWLWAEVHARLLPVAAAQLEEQQLALARAQRAAGTAGAAGTADAVHVSAEQLYRVMLPCQMLYFYVLGAPRVGSGPAAGVQQLQDAFLKAGLLRSLVLLFIQLAALPGAEPLRCALLLACTAAQPLADWAAAVPGFTAAVGGPAMAAGGLSGLHGALWRLLLGSGNGELAALLGDATPADKVPAVYQALQLMADVQAVSRRTAPLWGADVEGALRTLADTLRQQYSRQHIGEGAGAASESGAAHSSSGAAAAAENGGDAVHASGEPDAAAAQAAEAADDKKLGRPAEEQAAVLAARRAAQLQPACLKLIKDLLQRRAGGGKHD